MIRVRYGTLIELDIGYSYGTILLTRMHFQKVFRAISAVYIQGHLSALPSKEETPIPPGTHRHIAFGHRRLHAPEQVRVIYHHPRSAGRDPQPAHQLRDGGHDGVGGPAPHL